MRKGKAASAPDGPVVSITYTPNFEYVGKVWREDGELRYEANEFARNPLVSNLRAWADLWDMHPDSPEFFDLLSSGAGWRWEMTTETITAP